MRFEVTILGSSSATPIYNRNPTAQLLNCFDKYYLIDCGEGTQQQMLRFDLKSQPNRLYFYQSFTRRPLFRPYRITFIAAFKRPHKTLAPFGPPELKVMIDMHFQYSQTVLQYQLVYKATQADRSEIILENEDLIVETIILQHRIACTGFLFKQKSAFEKIIKERIEELKVPHDYVKLLKRGADFTDEKGRHYTNEELTTEPDSPKSYAYCSDSIYDQSYFYQLKNVDLLYHESTFMHDMVDRAQITYHTTALQAGEIAKICEVKRLLIGHFSARYKNLGPLLEEARSIFPDTDLAMEGRTFII